MPHETVISDGSFDFAGGVDSNAVTTVRSQLVPHGVRRDQLTWLNNGTVRTGGIIQRPAQKKIVQVTRGLYQGGVMYEPFQGESNPYQILAISGHIYKVLVEAPFTVTDLSAVFGVTLPADQPIYYFCQGEGFLVIQCGDGVTPPLFYCSAVSGGPGEFLRKSNGLTGNTATSELPPALSMVYYAGRIWYSQGRRWTAGDIVGNQTSGTLPYSFRDSVLKVTENPLAFSGDGFSLPSQAGTIRALAYTANLDTQLGQGPLYVFTRKQVYAMVVPVTRADWIAANNNNTPVVTVAQINNGSAGDRCIVHVNGDLFYESFDPAIRSLIVATRFYKQWGNIQISNNVNRALQFNDRALMKFASGVEFDNRLLECILPRQTASGVVHQGILPLDFDLVSTLQEQAPPAWEGLWEGFNYMQLFTGDFGGLQRCTSVVLDAKDNTIDIVELTTAEKFDNGGTPETLDNRVAWQVEFPAFTWGKEFDLKQLHGGEMWVDRVVGTVNVEFWYRPDADPCWKLWFADKVCAARTCAEDVTNPICYPTEPIYRQGWKWTIGLPEPPDPEQTGDQGRLSNVGYQFQVKVVLKGFLRIRGLILYAEIRQKGLYDYNGINWALPAENNPMSQGV